jgi:hypothetical protein
MRKLTPLGLVAVLAAALAVGPAAADDEPDHGHGSTWRVTVTNLTPPGSQPLSPPLLVVHSRKADVWSVGEIASHGVAAIAEDANNGPLASALPLLDGVKSAETGAGGPIPPGASRSYEVVTAGRYNRLTLLTMLVNTNDAFTGLDAQRLARPRLSTHTMAYDAGSERNNELASHIPGPCCGNPFVRDPEGALVGPHEGISGRGDLAPATYGWHGAVARIEVERLG